ncbi:LTA synthase family protein [Salimicrobium flavidum]|uniref:Phosphoglycerol transferase MdoB n=1 Tax=Salimicrobium flavidum TaxID=570947 RepID=A0A1N7IWE9_9BACI|nr:sulfatase-like hydrolase/transferase [Salimicrobium flavidum]SIS41399.1 Phosphoglycerol transferase MdoB [Salimicrobium flavidum]
MINDILRMIPLFLFSLILFILGYIVTAYLFFTGWDGLVDWAQVHTLPLGLSIIVLSLLLWGAAVWFLDKKEMLYPLYRSKTYRIVTAVVISLIVGTISAFLFLFFHLDTEAGPTVEWGQEYPLRFMLTAVLLFVGTLFLVLLTGEAYIGGALAFVLFFLMAIANYYKKLYRNEPLFPNDFVQIGQLQEVLPFITDNLPIGMIVLASIGIIALLFLWYKSPKIKMPIWFRIVLIIPVAYLLYASLFYEDKFTEGYYEKYASFIPWNQQNNYYANGPLLGMISNIKLDVVEEPEPYNEAVMEEAVENAQEQIAASQQEAASGEKPNVIFYVNETFWDPTKLDLEFSEDPMKHTRQLMKENPSGQILSPAFGGETANVEFELLTGYSMSFMNAGGNPFNHLLANKPYYSSASFFNDQGYYSEAMHPNSGSLYRRSQVYPNLGFDTSTFLEDMTYTEKDNRSFVSDESVTKELMDVIEEEEDPAFIHAVTIANHLPYNDLKYENVSSIEVSGKELKPETKTRFEVFSEGIKRSDETLRQMNETIQEMEEPTVLVFFGDHLPAIGYNLEGYKEADFGDEETQKTDPKFYQTPLLFLSNFDMDMEQDLGTVSPFYITPMIAEALNYETPMFYDYLLRMKEDLPAFRDRIYMQEEGPTLSDEENFPAEVDDLMRMYHLFEYDNLAGEEYSEDALYSP